jgi:mannose/cellobiose epimerase-like protein (N-acyl-D-glucosamine 2-epimerase family)
MSGLSQAQTPFNPESHRASLESAHAWLDANSAAVWEFWKQKGAIDDALDGFYGDINLEGISTKGRRNSIQQGRQLFTASIQYRLGKREEQTARIAYNQYRYFIQAFHDPIGGEVFILDSHKPSNAGRRLYNNAFAIYGLAHYHLAFRDHENVQYRGAASEALDLALNVFIAMDQRAYDPTFGGYQQKPTGTLALNEIALDGGDKEINTHLHIMEALTTLVEAYQLDEARVLTDLSPDDSAYVQANLPSRLKHMLTELLVGRFCIERGEYAYCRTEFTRNWTVANNTYFSYGHDIETAWLFLEALRVLGDDVENPEPVVRMAEKLIRMVNAHGFQYVGNGAAIVGRGRISDFAIIGDWKDWWQQVEAIAGLYAGARITTDAALQTAYLNRLGEVTTYLDQSGIKVSYGPDIWEFKWNTGNNTMANQWKAGYHTLRAFLFVRNWIEDDLNIDPVGIMGESDLPKGFSLEQNSPNPFNPSTEIRFTLDAGSQAKLAVYDLLGREVAVLVNEPLAAGNHAVSFDARNLSTGTYLYRLTSDHKSLTRSLMLLK